MCRIHENPEVTKLVRSQVKEAIDQTSSGVVLRLGTITCPCGWKRAIMKMYQCLYCKVWFCDNCAEEHFGQTVEEYHEQKENRSEK